MGKRKRWSKFFQRGIRLVERDLVMSKHVSITDMLHTVADGGQPQSELVDFFRHEMTKRVERHLSAEMLGRVAAEAIFLEAIRSALSEVAGGRMSPKDRDEFRNFLVAIVDRKRKTAVAREHSGKRSVRMTEPLVGDLHDDHVVAPSDQAVANEIVDACWDFCLRQDTGPQRDATIMGIMGQLPASQIRRILGELYGENDVRSERSIQLWVQASKAALQEHLLERFELDVRSI